MAALLGRGAAACREAARLWDVSSLVWDGGMDGWKEDVEVLAACKPGRELSGMGCENRGLHEGTIQDIP